MPEQTVQLPMVGTWRVRVHAARAFTIHSDLYYELHIERLGGQSVVPGRVLGVRLPQHSIAQPPAAGDVLDITFLMGQITSATKLDRA